MTHIKITKGLDIPISGKPEGKIQPLVPSGEVYPWTPKQIALDLNSFDNVKFRLLAKAGDRVKLGQPIAEDKDSPGRMFAAPAGGVIREIRRGLKRRLLDIVIDIDGEEEYQSFDRTDVSRISRESLIERLKLGGLFVHIRQRPFNFLADPKKTPRSIFVKALESAPLAPPAELQVLGYEREFQAGLNALRKLTDGNVNLVYRKDTSSRAFVDAEGVEKHTVEGPHPAANHSLHIQAIDPILSPEDVIWTLNAHDVVCIGHFIMHGRYFVRRVISIAGPGVLQGQSGYFEVREGFPIEALVSGKIRHGLMRLISGDVLTGHTVNSEDFLGFYDYCFCVVPENQAREFLYFMRLGTDRYTATGTYLSGHFSDAGKGYDFTTSQHGEKRPFIDASVYDRVMPLNVPTMHLVRAILAEDYDLAVQLGLMEVDSEDFALASFIDPSKIEMGEIVRKGLQRYAADILK